MKKLALAFVTLAVLSPVLCLADTAPAAPPAEELLQQIFVSPAASPAPVLMTTTCEPTCDELDGQWCDAKGTCYTGPACVPVGCFCFQNHFLCP